MIRFTTFVFIIAAFATACADEHAHDEHEHENEPAQFLWAGDLATGAATGVEHTLTLTLRLAADSTLVEGGTVWAEEPLMPLHGHTSGTVPTVVDVGAGVYEITLVSFLMPGAWTMKVHALKGELHEHHVFEFAVADGGAPASPPTENP